MGKVPGLLLLVLAAAGAALTACDTPQANAHAPSVAYERQAPIDRTPLAPPVGYDSGPAASGGTGDPPPNYAPAAANSDRMIWRPSPRWAAINGQDKIDGEQAR